MKFQADAKDLACAKDLTILKHGGPVQAASTVRERVCPQKQGTGEPFLTWSLHVRDSTHQQGGERDHQWGMRKVSRCRFRRVYTVRQFFSRSAYFSCCANIGGRLVFPVRQHFCRRKHFSMRQVFSIRQRFWMRQCFCIYFAAPIFLCIFLHSYLVCANNSIGADILRLLG